MVVPLSRPGFSRRLDLGAAKMSYLHPIYFSFGERRYRKRSASVEGTQNIRHAVVLNATMVVPRGIARMPVPKEVPADIVEDYMEACLVLVDSPKASAALSRRCLQNLLRQAAGVKQGNLSGEIQQVLDSGKLPPILAENIDAFATSGISPRTPIRALAQVTSCPVEPLEAEWNLEVLESLFDFYFVQPARDQARERCA